MITKSLWDGIKGVVFDAVGTLIEPSPPVADVYRAAAARQGVALEPEVIRDRFRRHFRDDDLDEMAGPMVTDEASELRRWRRIVGGVLPEVPEPGRAFEELWGHFARPGAWRCFPDVAGSVRRLSDAGFPVRVASNFDGRLRGVVAGLPEIAGLGESLFISSEVGFRKPHPEFYRAVCVALGLPPGQVLFVGDDPENDVEGPNRAGLRAARLDRSRHPEAGPNVLPGLAALVGLLGD